MPFTFHIVRKGAPISADELARLALNERCLSFEQTRAATEANPKTGEVIEISSRAGTLSLDFAPHEAKRLKVHVLRVAALLDATVEDDEGSLIS